MDRILEGWAERFIWITLTRKEMKNEEEFIDNLLVICFDGTANAQSTLALQEKCSKWAE